MEAAAEPQGEDFVEYAWRSRTIWQELRSVTARRPSHDAILSVDTLGAEVRISYSDLTERAERASVGLRSIGVRRGDRVALWMTNLSEWVITYLALLRMGATAVPLNTWLKDEEISYCLRQSRVRHLVVLDRFRSVDFLERLSRMIPELNAAEPGSLFADSMPELRTVTVLRRSDDSRLSSGTYDLDTLLTSGTLDSSASIEDQTTPSDLALVKYTSGSTGFPKGVMLEQGGLRTDAMLASWWIGSNQDDRWFSAMPFFHAGGSLWGLLTALLRGGTLVFTEAFDADLSLKLMERERCTIRFGVASMTRRELEHPRFTSFDLSALRMSNSGGDGTLAEEMTENYGISFFIRPYGLTEVYSPIAVSSPTDRPWPALPDGYSPIGRFLPGIEHKIVDAESGVEVAPGQIGEIWIRGLSMRGYFDKPVETTEVLDEDRWIHSGDLGCVDDEGYLCFAGRVKAMLKVGGENVSIEEVEACVKRAPGVRDAVVVPVSDRYKTQVPYLYVVPTSATCSEEEIRSWSETHLARFKVPAHIELLAELPLTGPGKPDRPRLQARAEETVLNLTVSGGAVGMPTE